MELSDISSVHEAVSRAEKRICIEGFCGSGKSPLASALSILPAMCILRVDSFCRERKGHETFFESIDTASFSSALQVMPQLTIIEGILLRQIIPENDWNNYFWIYIKRFSKTGIWHDGLNLSDDPPACWLDGEVMQYHENFRPHEKADIVYCRSDDAAAE